MIAGRFAFMSRFLKTKNIHNNKTKQLEPKTIGVQANPR